MDLYSVDLSTLSDAEKMKLFAFRDAYRPHSPAPSKKMLKAEANGYFSNINTLDEIKEQSRTLDAMYYNFLQVVTRDDKGNIIDD